MENVSVYDFEGDLVACVWSHGTVELPVKRASCLKKVVVRSFGDLSFLPLLGLLKILILNPSIDELEIHGDLPSYGEYGVLVACLMKRFMFRHIVYLKLAPRSYGLGWRLVSLWLDKTHIKRFDLVYPMCIEFIRVWVLTMTSLESLRLEIGEPISCRFRRFLYVVNMMKTKCTKLTALRVEIGGIVYDSVLLEAFHACFRDFYGLRSLHFGFNVSPSFLLRYEKRYIRDVFWSNPGLSTFSTDTRDFTACIASLKRITLAVKSLREDVLLPVEVVKLIISRINDGRLLC